MKPTSWLVVLNRQRRRALRVRFRDAHRLNRELWREAAEEGSLSWIDWVYIESPNKPRWSGDQHAPNTL